MNLLEFYVLAPRWKKIPKSVWFLVYKVLVVMGFTLGEYIAYQFRGVALFLYEQWKDNRQVEVGHIVGRFQRSIPS